MAVDAVLQVVQAAAAASGQHISHGFLRLLSKLAAHAEGGTTGTRVQADSALRDQVARLVTGWDLGSQPGEYAPRGSAWHRPSRCRACRAACATKPSRARVADRDRDGQAGPVVWRALDDLLAIARDPRCSICWSTRPTAPWHPPYGRVWRRPSVWRCGSRTEPVDFSSPAALRHGSTPRGAGSLLDALATAESRAHAARVARSPDAPRLAIVAGRHCAVGRRSAGMSCATCSHPAGASGIADGFSAASFAAHADGRVPTRSAAVAVPPARGARSGARAAPLRRRSARAAVALHAARQGCPAAAVARRHRPGAGRTLDPSCERCDPGCSAAPAPRRRSRRCSSS